jgi:hypothetical protein
VNKQPICVGVNPDLKRVVVSLVDSFRGNWGEIALTKGLRCGIKIIVLSSQAYERELRWGWHIEVRNPGGQGYSGRFFDICLLAVFRENQARSS